MVERNCSGVGASHSASRETASVRDELIGVPFVAACVDPLRSQGIDVRSQATLELLLVSRTFLPPPNLREREQARESHELEVAVGRDELRPYRRFDAKYARRLFGREAVRHGI